MKISLLPKCGSISKMFTASYPINPFESTTGVIQMQSKPMPCHKMSQVTSQLGSHFTGSCHKKQEKSKIPPHLDVVQTIYDPTERAPAVATTSVVDPISRQVTICRVQSLDMKGQSAMPTCSKFVVSCGAQIYAKSCKRDCLSILGIFWREFQVMALPVPRHNCRWNSTLKTSFQSLKNHTKGTCVPLRANRSTTRK